MAQKKHRRFPDTDSPRASEIDKLEIKLTQIFLSTSRFDKIDYMHTQFNLNWLRGAGEQMSTTCMASIEIVFPPIIVAMATDGRKWRISIPHFLNWDESENSEKIWLVGDKTWFRMFVEWSDTAIDTCGLMNIWQFGAKSNNPHKTRTEFEVKCKVVWKIWHIW